VRKTGAKQELAGAYPMRSDNAGAQRQEESRGRDGRYSYAAARCGAASLRNAAARPNVSPMV